ncbi:MAG TPA: SHOCT domain-containing protein [Anaerolineae bacterium]|nr:SHOCT domain-containing protein [Anaerolineae bacterium]
MMTGFGDFGTFGWIGMILNWVITIGLILGVVLLIAWLVRRIDANGRASQAAPSSVSPRDILQVRYARGEITREQYQQMLADLNT